MIKMMIGEKMAREAVKFLRSQKSEEGAVKLLGIKVELDRLENACETSEYINFNYPQFTAHKKDLYVNVLSISHKDLTPANAENADTGRIAENIVSLLNEQKKQWGMKIKLLSIKALLPEGTDAEEVSEYILNKYSEYRVHSKNQGDFPIVAIGYR